MVKVKNTKKCLRNCNECGEVDCAGDFRSECFGINCTKCKLDCRLKALGIAKAYEGSADRYLQQHSELHNVIYTDDLSKLAILRNTTITDPILCAQFDIARKLAFFYIEHPAEFEKYVLEFFCGKTQSDIARERGVSRQHISKIIKNERNEKYRKEIKMLKQRNAAFDDMTATELKVYQLYYVDSVLNISNLARQAGISRVTAYKTLHNLSSKYGLTFTVDKENKSKN